MVGCTGLRQHEEMGVLGYLQGISQGQGRATTTAANFTVLFAWRVMEKENLW